MFSLLLLLPAEQFIAQFQEFQCKRTQQQTGLFSTFGFIANNCRKGLGLGFEKPKFVHLGNLVTQVP